MDRNNYEHLIALAPEEHHNKIDFILNEAFPSQNKSVPDPYYTEDGFDEVFELLDAACEKIILQIENND